jgi:hypothetical protein
MTIGETAEAGRWMDLVHPDTSEPLGLQMLVHGEDSSHVREARNRISAMAARMSRRRGGRKTRATFDDVLESEIILAKHSVSDWRTRLDNGQWEHVCYFDSEDKRPYSKPHAADFFGRHQWAKDQVIEFLEDRGNFIES